jgi:hypothetical protein
VSRPKTLRCAAWRLHVQLTHRNLASVVFRCSRLGLCGNVCKSNRGIPYTECFGIANWVGIYLVDFTGYLYYATVMALAFWAIRNNWNKRMFSLQKRDVLFILSSKLVDGFSRRRATVPRNEHEYISTLQQDYQFPPKTKRFSRSVLLSMPVPAISATGAVHFLGSSIVIACPLVVSPRGRRFTRAIQTSSITHLSFHTNRNWGTFRAPLCIISLIWYGVLRRSAYSIFITDTLETFSIPKVCFQLWN